jgi:tetratricopeptide (TPR) repeat protein
MADVFISYSRANSAFAHKLADELKKRQYEVWVDIAGIALTSQWWQEIQRGIESADNFALLMSPNSLGSPVCHLEIEYARKLNKRIIPINHIMVTDEEALTQMQKRVADDPYITELIGERNPDTLFHTNWQVISSINWFNYPPDEDQRFYEKLPAFVEALQVDMAHVRQHTRLLTRSKDWLNNKKNPELLLLGNDVASAEKWLAEWEQDTAECVAKGQPPKVPKPTDQIRAFITASHEAEVERQRQLNELQTSRERAEAAAQRSDTAARNARRILTGVALASAAILIGVVMFTSSQVATAEAQVATAVIQQREAQSDADLARTEVAFAGATATQIPPTLTQAAVVAEDALIEQEISIQFVDAILQGENDPYQIIARMDGVVEAYPEEASAYIVRGLAFGELGEDELAIEDFTQAIELDGQNPAAYLNRGGVYYEMGDYDRAIEDYDTALAIDPEYPLLYYNRGLVNYARGELEQALVDYTQAIELAPSLDQAYNNRGLVYFDLGNYEQAIVDYTESIAINPLQSDAYNNRGRAYSSLGEYNLAFADHDVAVEYDPYDAQLYISRGITYLEWEEYNFAVQDFSEALTLEPENALAYTQRGYTYFYLEDNERALEDLNYAIELDPEDPYAYLLRANIYYYLDEPALSLSDFEAYEALGGELSPEDQAMRDEVATLVETPQS